MGFTEKFKGLQSRRIRPVAPDARPPTAFEAMGGWSAAPDGVVLDEAAAERSARREGLRIAAELQRREAERPGQVPEHLRAPKLGDIHRRQD